LRTSSEIGEIAKALASAQAAMKGAVKGSNNLFFKSKYADLESVWDACREPLTKNGLCVVQFPKSKFYGTPEVYEYKSKSGEPQFGVKVVYEVSVLTRISHSSGQWMEDRVSTLLPNGNPQAVGSAITYLRRYALQSVAGIAPEDDDGEATTGRGNGHHEDRRPTPVSPAPPDYPVISEEQAEAIRAAAKKAGIKTKEDFAAALVRFGGANETRRIPADKYEHVMEQFALVGAPVPA
jgi:hypothetical protein